MSQLGDFESAIVDRLAEAEQGGASAFKAVRGCSGGYRPVIRDALRRDQLPVAYVAFIEDPTAPEIKPSRRGSHFAVLIAARTLRETANPREDNIETLGAFTLIGLARQQLDDYLIADDIQLINLHVRFVDADERFAVYELLYRVWPVVADDSPPGSPGGLTASAGGGGDVTLTWEPPTEEAGEGRVDVYKLYRKRATDSGFVLIEAAGAGELRKLLASQPTGESVSYQIVASNAGGDSDPSNLVTVML